LDTTGNIVRSKLVDVLLDLVVECRVALFVNGTRAEMVVDVENIE
jgi:hypothetical protein